MGARIDADWGRGATFDDIINHILLTVSGVKEDVKEGMENVAEQGADNVRKMIETRGTEKSGKAGRIDSGALLRSVDYRVTKDTDEHFEVEYGYIIDNESEDYNLFQEYGFTHRYGSFVPGMYAIRDSAIISDNQLSSLGIEVKKGRRSR